MRLIKILLFSFVLMLSFCFSSEYVAVVNGVTLNFEGFDKLLLQTRKKLDKVFIKTDYFEEEHSSLMSNLIVEQMIQDQLIKQYLSSNDFKIQGDEVNQRFLSLKNGFKNEKEFSSFLLSEGMSIEDLLKNLKDEVIKEIIVKKEFKNSMEISNSDVQMFVAERYPLLNDKKQEDILGNFDIQNVIVAIKKDRINKLFKVWIDNKRESANIVINRTIIPSVDIFDESAKVEIR